jgi:hypothetical protein
MTVPADEDKTKEGVKQFYVSFTGIELKSIFQSVSFWWHAVPSFMDAQRSEGNLHAETRTVGQVHHTYTVWTDRESMRKYLLAGPHRKAMAVSNQVGRYIKVYGGYHDTKPTWDDAVELWRDHGRIVVGQPETEHGDKAEELSDGKK